MFGYGWASTGSINRMSGRKHTSIHVAALYTSLNLIIIRVSS